MNDSERRTVIQKAIKVLRRETNNGDDTVGAKHIFGSNGIHPTYWGISKQQFEVFVNEVRNCHRKGELKNEYGNDPSHERYYSPEVFDDVSRGLNMHHVCNQVIKMQTKDFQVTINTKDKEITTDPEGTEGTETVNVPFLSYSLQRNTHSAGLLCEVFFSHAWDEPFFEAAQESWILGQMTVKVGIYARYVTLRTSI